MDSALSGRRLPWRAAPWLLGLLLAAEMAHETLGFGGPTLDKIFDRGIHDFLFFAAAASCLVRAASLERGRGAWAMIGLALLANALGEVIFSIFFADVEPEPFPTVADAFWLAYFPLAIAGLALLVRDRIEGFELHRWIDGIAVALIVATPAVALIYEPVLEEAEEGSTLGRAVELSYPIGDILILGAVVGVFALTAWRPGRAWLLLGLGLTMFAIADSVNAVQTIRGTYTQGEYGFVWSAGALVIAYAAWQPYPEREPARHLYGWREVALPMACQLLAVAIQVYAFFHEIPRSERILALAVLAVVIVQVWVTRPREEPRPAEEISPG
jgi:hypothetical protein